MSLFYIPDRWLPYGLGRFDSCLHVHHLDDNHYNCFLGNLAVVLDEQHTADHNRRR